MSTQRKAQAARANGAKSAGPKTEEGKKTSARNALKHGLTARHLVLAIEEEADFHSLRDAFLAELHPEGEIELDLVEQMVVAKWRQSRCWRIETGLIDTEIIKQQERVDRDWNGPDNDLRLALAFDSLAGWNGSLQHLNRYESRLRRQYERAFQQLYRLRAERRPPPGSTPSTEPETEDVQNKPTGLQTASPQRSAGETQARHQPPLHARMVQRPVPSPVVHTCPTNRLDSLGRWGRFLDRDPAGSRSNLENGAAVLLLPESRSLN